MEKEASLEERIRRAEEIYERRKNQNFRVSSNTINIGNTPDISLLKKTFIKIFFCVILYFSIFFIKNSENFFSNDFINKAREILSYDMDILRIYEETSKYLGNILNDFQGVVFENQNEKNTNNEENEQSDEQNKDSNNEENELNKDNIEDVEKNNIKNDIDMVNESKEEINKEGNIDDKFQNDLGSVDVYKEINSNKEGLSQMEKDAYFIKENFDINKPLEGIITSKFGLRTPNQIVSANHTGIDIGADEGTKIRAAINGKVTQVSKIGDYRKPFKDRK